MNGAQVATRLARIFDSPLEDREQMIDGGMWLAQLDEILPLPFEDRVRLCAAIIKLTVADPEDPEITLAFNWREPLANLTGPHRLMELLFKGWYAVNAASRIATAEDPFRALARERTYHRQHIEASQHRSRVRQVMVAAEEAYGVILGWYSILSPSTTPECRDAHGKNFRADVPPRIGYPGMVHGKCKCLPGAPWPNGEMLA